MSLYSTVNLQNNGRISPLLGLVHSLHDKILKFFCLKTIISCHGSVQLLVPVDPGVQIDPSLLAVSLLEVFGSGTVPDK